MDGGNATEEAGWLAWEIVDAVSRRTMHAGSRRVLRSEIEVVGEAERPRSNSSPKLWPLRGFKTLAGSDGISRRQIHVAEGFYISLSAASAPRPERMNGFGLGARRSDTPTFSWEWFVVKGNTLACKLQERGELEIQIGATSRGWEVVSTKLVTDVSLRILLMPIACLLGLAFVIKGPQVQWRVNLRKGSYVNWLPNPESSASTRRPN